MRDKSGLEIAIRFRSNHSMSEVVENHGLLWVRRAPGALLWLAALAMLPLLAYPASAAQAGKLPAAKLPGLTGYANPSAGLNDATATYPELMLEAKLTQDGADIERGIVWRVFGTEPGKDGQLPLVAMAKGGTSAFHLKPGSYLVHAAFGRAGATKRITVTNEARRDTVVLDAGGIKLNAVITGGLKIPPKRVRFAIYQAKEDANGDRPLILPNVTPGTVVRLNAGTYHVVSTYGNANAVVHADIRVQAGQVTEATIEQHAAQLTIKLVREPNGEAIADTAWTILSDQGDVVRQSVGAFASVVLAEGDYTIVAKNKDHVYQRDFTVVPGKNEDVEVLTTDTAPPPAAGGDTIAE